VVVVLDAEGKTTLEKRAQISSTALPAYYRRFSVKAFSACLPPVSVRACLRFLAVLTDLYRPDTGKRPERRLRCQDRSGVSQDAPFCF